MKTASVLLCVWMAATATGAIAQNSSADGAFPAWAYPWEDRKSTR